ncbi:hypothetical protein SCA6_004583 [Theobroma cacao]
MSREKRVERIKTGNCENLGSGLRVENLSYKKSSILFSQESKGSGLLDGDRGAIGDELRTDPIKVIIASKLTRLLSLATFLLNSSLACVRFNAAYKGLSGTCPLIPCGRYWLQFCYDMSFPSFTRSVEGLRTYEAESLFLQCSILAGLWLEHQGRHCHLCANIAGVNKTAKQSAILCILRLKTSAWS